MARNIFNRKEDELKQQTKSKRILVPVNGSEVDEEALRLAYTYALAKIGKGRSVSVDVVYVVEVPHVLPLNAELSTEIDQGEKALDKAEAVAREMGLQVDASILQARSPGAAIVDVSRENGAELIVMAVAYHTKLGELDMGRTLPYVLKNAACRVWVCRAPMEEEQS